MPQPTPYQPSADFSADEAANAGGRSTVATAALDAELADISTTLVQVLANLALNQRDDGEIRDQRVKLHTLAPEVLALIGAGSGSEPDDDEGDSPRTLRVPVGETLPDLPAASGRAGALLGFDAQGQPAMVDPATLGGGTGGGGDVTLARLASTADGEGAGLVGWRQSAQYPAGTVGAILQTVMSGGLPAESPWGSIDDLVADLGKLGPNHLTALLMQRIDLIDAPGGILDRIVNVEAAVGNEAGPAGQSAVEAAASAAAAAQAKIDAIAAANAAQGHASTAGGAATAAQGHAGSASQSAGDAGTAAQAAQQARVSAESAAGDAQAYRSQAAGSASDALGAASTASQQAGIATSAANTAGGHAGAAASSASSASSSATLAGQHATAAQQERLSAETARSQAVVAQGAAVIAQQAADGSAQAAAQHYSQTVAATGPLSAAVSSLSDAVAGPDGLAAQHVLKVAATRSDGKKVFAAVGLAATAQGDAGESQILLQADKLLFVPPGDPNAPPVGFLALGVVNGVTTLIVPAARIGDATIGAGKLSIPQLSAITADLGAITAGTITLNTAGYIRGGQTDYATGAGFFLGRSPGLDDFAFSLQADDGSYLRWSKSGGLEIGKARVADVAPGPGPVGAGANWWAESSQIAPTNTWATLRFQRDGTVWQETDTDNSAIGHWYRGGAATVGDGYDIRFDLLTSGGLSGGNVGVVGSWQQLSSAQAITVQTTEDGPAVRLRLYAYSIRARATGAVVASGQVTLVAQLDI